ncbi:sensor histidine kinase [Kocuria marina]|uniref:sensor histidine kinase n=1 Tax=Kocuria marina TaxID=223184 RepID=UPI0022E19522|nr:histidine kinase [Kocuria marina]
MVDRTTLDGSRDASASQGWMRAHRRLIDVAVAVLVFAYDLMFLVVMLVGGEFTPLMFGTALVLSLAMCVLYPLRCRSLPWVFAGMFTAAAVQVAIGIGLAPASVVMLGLMLYAIGSWGAWRLLIPAVVLTAGWAVLAGVPVVQDDRARVGEIGMLMLAYVLVALVGRLLRGRRERFEALQARAEQLTRERDAQAVIAAAEERTRIAREIHDIVSHSLGTMVVMADGAAQRATADPEQAGAAMERVRDTGRDAMNEMRRMLGVLRTADPTGRSPQPGLGEVDRLVAEVRATGLRVDVSTAGVPVQLPSGLDLAAFRIVQEALTNARKHGGPLLSLAKVSVTYRPDAVELTVTDDGREPAAVAAGAGGGHGLVGMRERVDAYGGSLRAGPRPGGGYEVHATLPLGGGAG